MYPFDPASTSLPSTPAAARDACARTGPVAGPADDHEPEPLVRVLAEGTFPVEGVLAAAPLEPGIEAPVAAAVSRGTSRRPAVADEATRAPGAFTGLSGRPRTLATERSAFSTRPSGDFPPGWPELERCVDGLLALLTTPLLLVAPPAVGSSAEAIAGRRVVDLVAELARMGMALRALETSLRASFTRVEHKQLSPLATTEATLDDLANGVVELQLALLAISHVGRLLADCSDEAVVRWARVTSEALVARLRTLATQATAVLEVLNRCV